MVKMFMKITRPFLKFILWKKNLFPESMKIVDVFEWTKEFYEDFDMEYAIKLSELFKLNIKKK